MMKKTLMSIVTSALLLVGCQSNPSTDWTTSNNPKRNEVKRVASEHVVSFLGGGHMLTSGAKNELSKFMASFAPYRSIRVTLESHSAHDEPFLGEVKRYLVRMGVTANHIDVDLASDTDRHTVRVIVEKYIIIPPRCSDWSEEVGDAVKRAHVSSSNFGCALETNFGKMVADPRHIIQGENRGHFDGTDQANAVQRYREGQADKPKTTSSTSTSGGGTSGALGSSGGGI